MKAIVLILCFVSACYCDFSDRPRNFSIELLYHTQVETKGHTVISPFGIWTLLTGVALGAEGDSLKQIKFACRMTSKYSTLLKGYKQLTKAVLSPTTKGFVFSSRNIIFLDDGVSVDPNFKKIVTDDFDASVKILDFSDPTLAAKTANSYIQNSGASVSSVLTPGDFSESRMLLTNLCKGQWTLPFNKSNTHLAPFHDENGKEAGNVNMMNDRASYPLSNIDQLQAHALEIPYWDDKRFSMLILLPHRNVTIDAMYNNLSIITLPEILKKLQDDVNVAGIKDVDISIPRFKISANIIVNKPLNSMGIVDIFDPKLANFKNVTDGTIFVSAIVHKADIEVSEKGVIPSALTSANSSDKMPTSSFVANRPFVYFIIEKKTTTVIFGGFYSKPTVY